MELQPNNPYNTLPPEILEKLESGVASITDSESYRSFLTTQARFWTYSPNNAILIAMQRPDATRVASYQTWKDLKRQVNKGEHGIKIIFPKFRRFFTEPEPPETKPTIFEKLIGFGVGNVFDQSQTSGAPLPEAPTVPVLDSTAGSELFVLMNSVAHREGVTVKRMATDHPQSQLMGYYEPATREIAVRGDVSQLQQTKTLAHELGHHFHGIVDLMTSPRDEQETLAESVAYVTLARYGLDSGERSFPYVATWCKEQEKLRRAMGKIQRVAGTLITKIDQVQTQHPEYQIPRVAERPAR